MIRLLILSILFTPFKAHANGFYTDPLLNWLYSQPVKVAEPEPVEDTHYENPEPTHDSWDNLYLCHYCEVEIIIDPYADMSEDGVYDLNYIR